MENTKITDQQLEEIVSTLSENKSEYSELMENLNLNQEKVEQKSYCGIDENTEDKPYPYNTISKEVIEVEKYVQIDPNTGIETELEDVDITTKPLTEELFKDETLDNDIGKETLKSFGMSEEDSVKIFDVITRYKNGEKFNVYHELPKSMQLFIRQLNGHNMATINATTREVLDQFIREMYLDNSFIDLQESLQKELKLLNLSQMYNDELKSNMEVELINKANKLEEMGQIEKGQMLKKISAAFIDSYKFESITKALNENISIRRKIKKDLSRYKRFVNDFNYKYEHSKFKINNIKLLENVVCDVMPDITLDDVRKFIIVICKVTKDMHPDNIEQHTFMYYTIQNILLLKYTNMEDSEFSKEIYNNLLNTIKLMKEIENNECNRCNI